MAVSLTSCSEHRVWATITTFSFLVIYKPKRLVDSIRHGPGVSPAFFSESALFNYLVVFQKEVSVDVPSFSGLWTNRTSKSSSI